MNEAVREILAVLCAGCGCLFYLAGTVGLLRFPDLFTCLHALSKADNIGLGLVAMGGGLWFDSWAVSMKLGAVWRRICCEARPDAAARLAASGSSSSAHPRQCSPICCHGQGRIAGVASNLAAW